MDHLKISTTDFNKKSTPSIIDSLNQSLVDEINIYHQAYLTLERPIMESSVVHNITKYELPISFHVQGDFKANIVCLLDTYKKPIKEEEASLFQSLYIESMNILLGKIITNLENKFYYNSILSCPMTLKKESLDQIIEDQRGQLRLNMGYTLTYNTQEFDCRILLNLKKQRFPEV